MVADPLRSSAGSDRTDRVLFRQRQSSPLLLVVSCAGIFEPPAPAVTAFVFRSYKPHAGPASIRLGFCSFSRGMRNTISFPALHFCETNLVCLRRACSTSAIGFISRRSDVFYCVFPGVWFRQGIVGLTPWRRRHGARFLCGRK